MNVAQRTVPAWFRLRDADIAPWHIALAAYCAIAAAFVFDMVTPQALDAEVTYAIPIVLAAFSSDRRLTYRLVLVAILADELGAIADAALASFRWDIIGIENRFLSLISLVIVAALTLAVQRAAERIGRLSAIDVQRRRQAALSSAADRVLASLGDGTLDAAIVEEAARVLECPGVVWCPGAESGEFWTFEAGVTRHAACEELPPHLADAAEAARGGRGVAPGGASVLSVPVADRNRFMGVLLAPVASPSTDPGLRVIAGSFAGLVVGALQQARLIGDLAEQNRRLSEKQSVIEGLIDAIAHDVRTPLAALSVTLKQAADGAYGTLPPEYTGVLLESKISIDEIARLAETLLLVARLEGGGPRTVRSRVRLDAVVRELASEFGAMASARGVDIVMRASEHAITLGARGDVRRAIANLVANAITHTPRGGTVELSACKAEGSVEVTVADDGYGIDERSRASLFQRFSPAAQAGTGTGLGLYIVRRVAEEMGGCVRYEPRDPRGSSFTLSFPVAA